MCGVASSSVELVAPMRQLCLCVVGIAMEGIARLVRLGACRLYWFGLGRMEG